MPDSNEKYLKLITSEHYGKPLYMQYVESFLNLCSSIGDILESFNTIFNLESAEGDQLDKIGELVGISRKLPVVIADVPAILSDDTYRLVIKAKVLKDHWDGTRKGMEDILSAIFPDLGYDIIDNFDMSIVVTIIDPLITDEQIALINNGFIIPKPSGVDVNYSISTSKIFGWDLSNDMIDGWETGVWNVR